MGNAVIYKANNTAWSAPVVKKFDDTASQDGVIKHANGVTWFDNYPMRKQFTYDFKPTWAQGYNASGQKLDPGVWGDKLWSGGATMGGISCIGYNNVATMTTHSGVTLLSAYVHVNLEAYSHNGNAVVDFFRHTQLTKPSWFAWSMADKTYKTEKTFIKGSWGGYWIPVPLSAFKSDTHGITFSAPDNTAVNSCKFSGLSTFSSVLRVTAMSPPGMVLDSNGVWVNA